MVGWDKGVLGQALLIALVQEAPDVAVGVGLGQQTADLVRKTLIRYLHVSKGPFITNCGASMSGYCPRMAPPSLSESATSMISLRAFLSCTWAQASSKSDRTAYNIIRRE